MLLFDADIITVYLNRYVHKLGTRGSVVIKAPCYKPEGRGFDTR
jgi:hypothetical protein